MFDGIGRVQARITTIEQRLGLLARAPGGPGRVLDAAPGSAGGTDAVTRSFAAALERAGAGTSFAAAGAPPRAGQARPGVGGFGRITPPPELAGYGNGRIPTEALEPIGIGGHRLWSPAAEAFRLMAADAAADGVTIGVTDSYRPYDEQVDLAQRKGLYREGGLAAVPGTSSHGWGMALDVDVDDRGLQWLRDNGWMYGWAETTPREPWHWEYRPGTA